MGEEKNNNLKSEKDTSTQNNEDKYQQLLNNMLDGYALLKLIGNDNTSSTRFIFEEVNPAFEKMTALSAQSLLGQTLLDIFPNLELSRIEECGKVAQEGTSFNFEYFSTKQNMYFDVSVFQTSLNYIGCTFKNISERIFIENALIDSENRWRRAITDSPIPIMIHDEDDNILQLSNGWTKYSGYTIADIPTLSDWTERAYGQRTGSKKEYIDKLFTSNKTVENGEWEVTARDGSKKIWDFQSTPLGKNNKGKRILHSMALDITDRKQAEESLRESEEHFAVLFQEAPLSYQSLDADGKFIEVNNEWLRTLGYERSEVIGKWFGDFLSPEYVDNYRKRFPIFKEKGKIHSEFQMLHKNGDKRYIGFEGRIKHTFDGSFEKTHCILQDITEHKKEDLALVTEKERLAVTLRSIADGVITTDIKGNIVMFNRSAEHLTGWSCDDALGHALPDVFTIIDEQTQKKRENPVDRVLTTGLNIEFENQSYLLRKDGKEIPIADSAAPIFDYKGKISGVVLVFRDMTAKQKLDDSILRTQKLESLGVLAGGIAHDFNNLLGGIFGYIEMALMKTTEEIVSNYLSKSLNNIDRARSLTHQLLTFSKGGAPIKTIGSLFPAVQKTVEFALSGSSVSSRFNIQNNLWLCDFDKNQIAQIIENLTLNAQQAMPNGGVIELTALNVSFYEKEHVSLESGNYVKLSIKDQGIGIPKELLTRIFDPYYTTKTEGHGLGLATCYSIVKKHGGCIEVESESPKGSTFHLYLPASSEDLNNKAAPSNKTQQGQGSILIMDDEESIRDVLKLMLESLAYTVILTKNGDEAVKSFMVEKRANRKITAMIFDLTIPGGMGGKKAIQEIRKIDSETPAFVTSGYSENHILANPEKYGFNAMLHKPFKMAELSEILAKYIFK